MKHYLFLILACICLTSCTPAENPVVSLTGNTMGTTYSVKYVKLEDTDNIPSPEEMQHSIDEVLIQVNQLMSTYIEDSELSLLNKAEANVSFTVSAETEYVLREAIKLNELSNGMLDVTVGPLVNLWGFGPNLRPERIPSQSQLTEVLEFVGIDKFSLKQREVVKHHAKVYIDLSTIAKGYGVDQVADLLASKGLLNYLVEIGGEMRVAGKKPGKVDWLIAIEKPITGSRAIQRIVSIGDNAIATSGDYRNYYEEDGVRYSHLINPISGFPIQHNLVSVTVVAEKSIMADGLATALIVLGAQEGIVLAEEHDIAALFISKEEGGFVEYQTRTFKQSVDIKE